MMLGKKSWGEKKKGKNKPEAVGGLSDGTGDLDLVGQVEGDVVSVAGNDLDEGELHSDQEEIVVLWVEPVDVLVDHLKDDTAIHD